MNALTRTVILLIVANLVVADALPAQDVSDEQVNRALAANQAEVAQKPAKAAQRQAEVERTPVPPTAAPREPAVPPQPAPVVSTRAVSFTSQWPLESGGAASVLVIPTAEPRMEELTAMTEDMTVMSRIFEKNLDQARIPTARGSFFVSGRDTLAAFLGGRGGATRSIYLQGYGALFLMKVDFPLSPPPQSEQKQAEETKKEETDPVWQEMRKEMYEPQEAGRRKTKEPQVEYDAEKVENLKATLVRTLKHAANIRSLKQDESVILVAAGIGEYAGEDGMLTARTEIAVNGHARIIPQQLVSRGSPQTLLVIRAKKADIDSFAKNALDYEQFRQRAQLFSCPCLGAGAGRGDTFGDNF